MNIDNIKTTIESLKASDTYTQSRYRYHCGTPACIAGHAAQDAINAGEPYAGKVRNLFDMSGNAIHFIACKWFGFGSCSIYDSNGRGTASQMFGSRPVNHKPVTKEDAIAMLEHFIETGRVDWTVLDACT